MAKRCQGAPQLPVQAVDEAHARVLRLRDFLAQADEVAWCYLVQPPNSQAAPAWKVSVVNYLRGKTWAKRLEMCAWFLPRAEEMARKGLSFRYDRKDKRLEALFMGLE